MVRAGITEAGFVLNLIVQSRMLSGMSRLLKTVMPGLRRWWLGYRNQGHPDPQHGKMKPTSKIKDRVLAGEMVLVGLRI